MIDPKSKDVQAILERGYKLAAHAYLQPSGKVNYTFVAKHTDTGQVVQGWSGGGTAEDAFADLRRRLDGALRQQ
jgi:hypothetical protein